MRLILTLPHNSKVPALLNEQTSFQVSKGVNSLGQDIDIISYNSIPNQNAVEQITPTLQALLDFCVAEFIQAIQEKNLEKLLATTLHSTIKFF